MRYMWCVWLRPEWLFVWMCVCGGLLNRKVFDIAKSLYHLQRKFSGLGRQSFLMYKPSDSFQELHKIVRCWKRSPLTYHVHTPIQILKSHGKLYNDAIYTIADKLIHPAFIFAHWLCLFRGIKTSILHQSRGMPTSITCLDQCRKYILFLFIFLLNFGASLVAI